MNHNEPKVIGKYIRATIETDGGNWKQNFDNYADIDTFLKSLPGVTVTATETVDKYGFEDGGELDRTGEVLGYRVENLNSQEPGKPAYKLHGKRVTYTLVRQIPDPRFMFVMNSKNNVGDVKGNYTFTDVDGELKPYYLGAELL